MSVTYETSFTMRGATGVIHQRHQVLRVPRKMTRIIDPRDTWNVIYNKLSNRCHPTTSPSTAPATENCTPKSKRNLPKTIEASFTMADDSRLIRPWSDHEIAKLNPPVRRAYFSPLGNAFCIENYNISRSGYLPRFHQILRLPRKVTLQDHQILRLPRKVTLMIDPRHIWNVIYNAQSNRTHPPTSPNTAPATQNDSHEWCPSHMKRHLQCAEQQVSSTNVTKYCACQEKWLASLILVTYETSFTMRGATGITLQPHQILRLPRRIALQNLRKFAENSWSVISNKGRFDHDPNMIRPWNCKTEPVRSQSLLFPPRQGILYWKLQHFALRLSTQISPNTAPATKSDTARSPNTAPATKSDSHDWSSSHMNRHLQCAEQQDSPSNVTKYCTCHVKWLSWVMSVTNDASFTMRVTWLNCYLTELLLYWAVTLLGCTLLSCYFTELLLYWTVTLLSCYFTELLLYWAVTLLNRYFTELLLYWAVALLSCYFTELLLYWAVTLLSCYFTELLLYWAVTLLSCYFTELLLYWAVTILNCYFTELLLYWTVTLLSCYCTELLLYWAVTLLSCYFTELLLYWTLCIFKSP